jgi:hypothetical protein
MSQTPEHPEAKKPISEADFHGSVALSEFVSGWDQPGVYAIIGPEASGKSFIASYVAQRQSELENRPVVYIPTEERAPHWLFTMDGFDPKTAIQVMNVGYTFSSILDAIRTTCPSWSGGGLIVIDSLDGLESGSGTVDRDFSLNMFLARINRLSGKQNISVLLTMHDRPPDYLDDDEDSSHRVIDPLTIPGVPFLMKHANSVIRINRSPLFDETTHARAEGIIMPAEKLGHTHAGEVTGIRVPKHLVPDLTNRHTEIGGTTLERLGLSEVFAARWSHDDLEWSDLIPVPGMGHDARVLVIQRFSRGGTGEPDLAVALLSRGEGGSFAVHWADEFVFRLHDYQGSFRAGYVRERFMLFADEIGLPNHVRLVTTGKTGSDEDQLVGSGMILLARALLEDAGGELVIDGEHIYPARLTEDELGSLAQTMKGIAVIR